MFYKSTRSNETAKATAAQVIKQGLATDGGLFVPESLPTLTMDEIQALCKESYPVRAAKVLSKFLTDYTYEELRAARVKNAKYGREDCLMTFEDFLKWLLFALFLCYLRFHPFYKHFQNLPWLLEFYNS